MPSRGAELVGERSWERWGEREVVKTCTFDLRHGRWTQRMMMRRSRFQTTCCLYGGWKERGGQSEGRHGGRKGEAKREETRKR